MQAKKFVYAFLIGIPVLLVVLLLAGLLVINTQYFRNFLRSEIAQQALLHAGARVTIGAVNPHWTHLDIDLQDVAVFSSAASAARQPAFLRAQRLEVSVPFAPLLHGEIHLRRLILDQPVVKLVVDRQGRSNIPVPPPSNSSSRGVAPIFDLAIADCAIHSGDLFYNDAEIPLDAEVHHLALSAGYSVISGNYTGSLSYDDGRLVTRGMSPVTHAANIKFAMDRAGLSISPLLLTTGHSNLTLNARLSDYSHPSIDGAYQGDIETVDVSQAFRIASLPLGNVRLSGKLAYRDTSGQPFLDSVALSGAIQSDRLLVRSGQRPFNVTGVTAAYDLRNANLQVTHLRAAALGAAIGGDWQMQSLSAAAPVSHLAAVIRGLSLPAASNVFAPRNVRNIPLRGLADLDARASWSGSVSNAVAHLRLAVVSKPNPVSKPDAAATARTIPVNGLITADYDGPRDTLSFGQSHLQTSQTQLFVGGSLRPNRGTSMLTVKATTANLAEVAGFVALVQSAMQSPGSTSAPLNIPTMAGSATLAAHVTGTVKNPRVEAHLAAENLQVAGSSWRSLALDTTAAPDQVTIQNGSLSGNAREQIHFAGTAALRHWSLQPASQISLQAAMSNMPVAEIQALGHLKYPVSGVLAANVSVHGTRQAPQGTATLSLANGAAWDEPIQNLSLTSQMNDGTIHAALELRIPAGSVSTTVGYTLGTQQYDLSVKSAGLDLAKLALLQKRSAVQGLASLSASGHGSVHDPQLSAQLNIPKFSIQGQTLSNIDARVSVANQHAGLQLQLVAAQGTVEAQGNVALTGDHYTTAKLDVRALPIAAVAAALLPSQAANIGGQTEIHVTATGPLSMPSQMEAHLQIPTLNVTYGKDQLALTQPLQADYRGGTLTLNQAHIHGMGTDLSFGGTIPIAHEAAYSLAADGTVDLSALNKFAPTIKSSGQIAVHLHGQGRSTRPDIEGQLLVKNAVFAAEGSPVSLEGLNAQVNIAGDRADIANFAGTAGGGSVSARGFFYFGHDPNFNLALTAQSVRIRYPEGLRSVLSGQINLQGSPADSAITGRVLVDTLSFTQQFDLATFASSFSSDSGGSSSSFENNMKIRISVQSAQNLNLASRENKLSIGGAANINVVGTLASPVVLGRIQLTSGEMFFLGKRFDIQSGTIEFANPVRTEPVLHLYVKTTIEQYDLTLNLTGPVDRLRTNYSSDPPLAPADIIHLLAFGNTNAEASSTQQSATTGAESALASQVSGQVAGKLENLTGISQLNIDPLATNAQGNVGAQIGIQERITGSLLFTFSTDVTTTQGQTVELQYDLNKTWSVTALRDQNGGYGLNLRYHKNF